MKIALIGNMNNNNFSIMRYFRDLGADAHLLLWANDGRGSMDHFAPVNDTWDIDKWAPYIHQTSITDSIVTVLGDPRQFKFPSRAKDIKTQFGGYDAYIGSGYAPSILGRAGIHLDFFYPYATGLEHIGTIHNREYMVKASWWRNAIMNIARNQQIAGVKNARHCLNSEMSLTKKTFEEIGKEFIPLAVPMVYNRERLPSGGVASELSKLAQSLSAYDVRILSHARQLWVRDDGICVSRYLKYTDLLICGFAKFIKSTKANAVLAMLEYGEDVEASKQLISELGIGNNVLWLPKMKRKEIMLLISMCDIGVGEFRIDKGLLWGGTTWEVLASGKPCMQTFNFTDQEYRDTFGHEPPPLLDVKSPEDVTRHLEDFAQNREKYIEIGKRSKEWFNKYNGIGLAKKWLDLLAT